jgi:hypothetical protein
MNIPRLERLILVLERVQTKGRFFDMEHWTRRCGSASCAIGWGAVDPVLRRQGLRLESGLYGKWKFPVFDGARGFNAVSWFFEISGETADHLFTPERYQQVQVRPEHVIERIREVLQGRSPASETD